MLAGVLADTHDNIPLIREATRVLSRRGAEYLIHAGDFVAPFALKALLEAGIPLTGVFGNNDGERAGLAAVCGDIHEPPYRFELGDRTILLTHDSEELNRVDPSDADVVIWAHTHEPAIEAGPPLRLNPGETGGWLTGRSTAALLDLERLSAEIVELKGGPKP